MPLNLFLRITLVIPACAATAMPAAAQDRVLIGDIQKTAPLLEGMGDFTHPVTTSNPHAQRYFDQGMVLAFGFNHAEAARSFRQAQIFDPECAMACWGEAWVLGPNINAPMSDEAVAPAWKALQKSLQKFGSASPRERDYILALAARYTAEPLEDRSPLDKAFADAMRNVAARYPDDLDAQVVFAEALMNTSPWHYWDDDGRPLPFTAEILTTLERVLARYPDHPQACHLYIHAVEKTHPEWAEACADRLDGLCPGAGHLVHMPSHIYIRLGRYADAVDVNEMAVEADNGYVAQCHSQGLYPVAYMPHNHHFLWFGACMQGRSVRAAEAACHMADHADKELMRQPGYEVVQHFWLIPLYSMLRFGEWDMILHESPPADDLKYPLGIWHYSQGMARLRRGDSVKAREHLAELNRRAADEELSSVVIWENNTARQLVQIAEQVLAGEIAAGEKDYDTAVGHLDKAVEIEDSLVYEEPQSWYAPTRLTLGAILLEAGRAEEAERAFREDLAKYPVNGWGLFGLHQALAAQGKADEAALVKSQFDEQWKRADVSLSSARF
jgi:tetratricopeptide (TPR) repeat protein